MSSGRSVSNSQGFIFFAILATAICLVSNFSFEQPRVLFLFDSTHYFETMQGFVALVLDFLHHKSSLSHSQYSLFLQHIRLDGPMFSFILGAPFVFVNKHPEFSDFKLLIIFQSLLQGVTTGFVWLLSLRLSNNKWSSAVATTAFMFYPPVVLQTQRLLTEPLACLLLTAFAWLITFRRLNYGGGIVVGFLAAALGLLKTALIVPVCLTIFLRALIYRSGIKLVLAAIFGLTLGILPWALFTNQFFHQTLLFADREPALNLALGFDLETGGLPATYRGPFCQLVFDLESPYQSAIDLLTTHPLQYAQLFIIKAIKMVVYPWNDFRHAFFGIDAASQFPYHALLLLAGISGISLYLFAPARRSSSNWRAAALCLGIIMAHGVYILVQPNPRYLVTAAPLLCAFVAFGLSALHTLPVVQLRLTLASAAIFTIALYAITHFTSFQSSERVIALRSGESLTRTFKLDRGQLSPRLNSAFVLIDGDGLSSDSEVSLNGVLVNRPLQTIYEFDQTPDRQTTYGLINTVARYSGFASLEKFRQWRAVQVPESLLRDGANVIAVRQTAGNATVAANSINDRRLPTLTCWGIEQAVINPLSLDGRFESPILCAARSSVESSKLTGGDQVRRPLALWPRIKLILAADFPSTATVLLSGPTPTPNSTPTSAVEADFTNMAARVSSTGLEKADSLVLALQPKLSTGRYNVRLTGEAMRTGGAEAASIRFLAVDPGGAKRPGILPTRITPGAAWTRFVLDGTIDLKGVPEVAAFELQFFPKDQQLMEEYGLRRGCSDTLFRKMHIKLTPDNLSRVRFSQYIII